MTTEKREVFGNDENAIALRQKKFVEKIVNIEELSEKLASMYVKMKLRFRVLSVRSRLAKMSHVSLCLAAQYTSALYT